MTRHIRSPFYPILSPSAPDSPPSATLEHFLFAAELDGPDAPQARRAEGAIWLSCCDGVAPSLRARRAAEQAFARQTASSGLPLPRWFDALRSRLLTLFGAPDGEAVLAGSEREAEAIFSALSAAVLARPIRVIRAAAPEAPEAGAHDSLCYALRDRYGLPRDSAELDVEVDRLAAEALRQGHDIALHLTDCSETGLPGPSRAAARAIAAAHRGRVVVLIDARQMRISQEQVAADLAAGFAVLVSGATFAGAPRGTAALLLPRALVKSIESIALAEEAQKGAALSWPRVLREKLVGDFSSLADIGLGLRWECALAELEALFAVAPDLRTEIVASFSREIGRHLAAAPNLKAVDCGLRPDSQRTLFPILTFDERGRALKSEPLRRALADPAVRRGWMARGRPVHLGSALRVGERKALRLSLSAPLVNDVAERIAEGRSFAAAFQLLADDLLETFTLWSELTAPVSP